MLIITRHEGQWLHLVTASGEKISLCLTTLSRKYAAIGVVTSKSTAIIRDEVLTELEAKGVDTSSAAAIMAALAQAG